jgi:hypothetical protein
MATTRANEERAATGDEVRGHVRKILKRLIASQQSEAAAVMVPPQRSSVETQRKQDRTSVVANF